MSDSRMVFNIQPHEREIFRIISEAGAEQGVDTYVVGGYVRDRLLGRPSKDMDIVCIGSGIGLARAVARRLYPIPRVTVFKRFGTAMLNHQELEVEFVGARKESYRPDSRKPTVEEGSLEDDQNRRDFTINALAVSLNARDYGTIIDPFHGLADLEKKIIRTPLEPGKTFSDDPLRILRGIRFASQLGFRIEDTTYAAMADYRRRLEIVSRERIATELNKIILSNPPSNGLRQLYDTGILEIIFPELARMHGREVRNGVGHKDNFYHTLEVLDNIARHTDDLWLRWAALLHDIGKPATKRFSKEAGWTFRGHQAVGAGMVPKIFRKMRLPQNEKMKFVQKMVALHMRPISLTTESITDSGIRRLLVEAGDDLEPLMLLAQADITSKNPQRVKRYLRNYAELQERMAEIEAADQLRNWQPPITGELIMQTFGIPPGRQVGEIKNYIREGILDGDIANDYDAAFAAMLERGKALGLTADVDA